MTRRKPNPPIETPPDEPPVDEEGPEPGENLREAESEIGINDWIDCGTGEPAEGQSPPHLEEE
jgi:hypothetical protein